MSHARFVSFFSLVSFTAVLAVSATGCGKPGATSTCDAAFDCGSLTKAQYDACVVEAEQFEITANKTGCVAQFQAVIDCGEAEGICSNGQYSAYTCDNEWQAFQFCAGES